MVDIGITGSLSMSRAFVDQSYCVVISEIMKKVALLNFEWVKPREG